MNPVYEKLQGCLKSVREKTDFVPKVAIVLGSGLGDYADDIEVVAEIDYSDIEGFPVSTVPGHAGKFIFGYVKGVPVVCMKGRVHYYEGYPISDVVLPTRLMKLMGAEVLFLTNASGGINPSFTAGDFMMLTDHISLWAPNPLIGQNIDGPMFVNFTSAITHWAAVEYRNESQNIAWIQNEVFQFGFFECFAIDVQIISKRHICNANIVRGISIFVIAQYGVRCTESIVFVSIRSVNNGGSRFIGPSERRNAHTHYHSSCHDYGKNFFHSLFSS